MNRKLTVFNGTEPWFRPYAEHLPGFTVKAIDGEEIPGDTDCALVFQEYSGDKLVSRIRNLQQLLIPVAVATCDGSPANQEFLLECGADDVIVMPLPGKLLNKRLEALPDSAAPSQTLVDFTAFDRIREANQGRGSYIVQENDFTNIYRFVVRLLERLDQKAQLILFNFQSDFGAVVESDSIRNFMKIVQACLRRGDISSVHGKQVFVILMGADEIGGHCVIQRVLNAYNAHFNDDTCDITFEMREISNEHKPAQA